MQQKKSGSDLHQRGSLGSLGIQVGHQHQMSSMMLSRGPLEQQLNVGNIPRSTKNSTTTTTTISSASANHQYIGAIAKKSSTRPQQQQYVTQHQQRPSSKKASLRKSSTNSASTLSICLKQNSAKGAGSSRINATGIRVTKSRQQQRNVSEYEQENAEGSYRTERVQTKANNKGVKAVAYGMNHLSNKQLISQDRSGAMVVDLQQATTKHHHQLVNSKSQVAGVPNQDAKALKKDAAAAESSSDDSECLVANETLQFSTTKQQTRRKPSPEVLRRLTKKDSFKNKPSNYNRRIMGSFCTNQQQASNKVTREQQQKQQQNRVTARRQQPQKEFSVKGEQQQSTSKRQSKNTAGNRGVLTNTNLNSPVQDEMTVNMAIKKGVSNNNYNSKQTNMRGAVTKRESAKNNGVTSIKRDKENEVVPVAEISSTMSEQDTTIVVSAAMVLSDAAILKAVNQNTMSSSQQNYAGGLGQTQLNHHQASSSLMNNGSNSQNNAPQQSQHGRNFSVNLPYASKPMLHTNMSTLQINKKTSLTKGASQAKPTQPRTMKRTSINASVQNKKVNNVSRNTKSEAGMISQPQKNLKVSEQPISADYAYQARNIGQKAKKTSNEDQMQATMSEFTAPYQRMEPNLRCQDVAGTEVEECSSILGVSLEATEENLQCISNDIQSTSENNNPISMTIEHKGLNQDPVERQFNTYRGQQIQTHQLYQRDLPAACQQIMTTNNFFYGDGSREEDSSLQFYEIDCPENISEEEEPELGLGELLEEHRAHFFMEKLSGNFSSSNEVISQASSKQKDHTKKQQSKVGQTSEEIVPIQERQAGYSQSQPGSSDQQMQSCSMGAMSESLNNGANPDGIAGTSSLIMRSDEGHSFGGPEEDKNMKSSQMSLMADEQISLTAGALVCDEDQEEDSSSFYPQVKADQRSDFQKASDIIDNARAEADEAHEINGHQKQDLNAAINADDGGVLHADAEEDLRMIQEQLRKFSDVSINERESIIKDHLEAPLNRHEQEPNCQQNELKSDENIDLHSQVLKIQEQFEEINLQTETERESAKFLNQEQKNSNLDYCKDLLQPDLCENNLGDAYQQMLDPIGNGISAQESNALPDIQNVRFESTQKHQRAVTKQNVDSADSRIVHKSNGHKNKQLFVQEKPAPVMVYKPLSREELACQKHDFDQDFYDKMLRKEYNGRLRLDYFTWQTKIDKLMRATLMCWMDELCTDMRFQKTTFYMALAYCDKFFEAAPCIYGPEDLQLVGVTAVFLAAKVEEVFVPTIKVFSKSTNFSSSVRRICQMERDMMSVLSFHLHPITLISWADYYTKQWDEYADIANLHSLTEVHDCAFRQFTLHSYNRYRTFMTYLDAVAIDYRAHEFQPRQLIAALLYLVIGNQQTMTVFPNYYQMAVQFTVNPPIPEFEIDGSPAQGGKEMMSQGNFETPESTDAKRIRIDQQQASLDPQIVYYNDKVFSPFLQQHFQMQLYQIREAVMYVAKFLALNLEIDPPDCSGLGEDPEDVKIEEYIGLQTANSNMLNYLDWIVKHEEQQRRQTQQQNQRQDQQPTNCEAQKPRRGKVADQKGSSTAGSGSSGCRKAVGANAGK